LLELYFDPESALHPFLNNTECQKAPRTNDKMVHAITASQLIEKNDVAKCIYNKLKVYKV